MARFLGAIQGARGEATRLGGTASGIRANAQGWSVGVKVYGSAEKLGDKERDVFHIYANGGSNGASPQTHIATVIETDTGYEVQLAGTQDNECARVTNLRN